MNIIVAITGGIAAYKTATLVRELIKQNCDVKVIMTKAAKDFITPLTLATLSNNPVAVENFDPESGAWNSHVNLAEWADAMIIAPATANTIAKMNHGIADNLVLCTYLSARCPIIIAPAMDLEMFKNTATVSNIHTLRENPNIYIIEPTSGFLASGLIGKGRMAEPQDIATFAIKIITPQIFKGKKIMITAGGTVENIDPVRCITNHSTGKMGIELAHSFAKQGAEVTILKANTSVYINPVYNINVIETISADTMLIQAQKHYPNCDIAIFAAAVADYKIENPSTEKIKHTVEKNTIQLVPNPDIALEMGKLKSENQINIGFALETVNQDNAALNAKEKLDKKNFDAIVLNTLDNKGAGFASSTNKISIITVDIQWDFELKIKEEVAEDIVNFVADILLQNDALI